MSGEDVFFAEWERRGPAERRSLTRARSMLAALSLEQPRIPVLTVVGSKGKGTIATFASACLAAAGLRVCTVTSPGLRSNRERIRVNGAVISADELRGLAERLAFALPAVPPDGSGYLSPAGLFTLAGALHAQRVGADALVLEAGMGGRSDEVSLFGPTVVAIGPVFAEHLGVLGAGVAEIAEEKSGVVDEATRAVLSVPQTRDAADAIARTVSAVGAVKVETVSEPEISAALLPAGLGQANGTLGRAAAHRLLDVTGRPAPSPERESKILGSLILPGRLSWHPLDKGELLIDSAISRPGVAAALSAARARWPRIDHALVCFPDGKDLEGAIAELTGLPVTFVRLPEGKLEFSTPLPGSWKIVESPELTPSLIANLGRNIIALGTVYFTGTLMNVLNIPTDPLFTTT